MSQKRFTLATDDTIEELQNGTKDINTSKSTSFWLSAWKTWCEGKSTALEIEEYEAHSQKCVPKSPGILVVAIGPQERRIEVTAAP